MVKDRPLILGGISIPYHHGLLGHSDADVLLHAVIDAILGALGLGDIGQHFPDTDPRFLGANSRDLLRHTYQLMHNAGYAVLNLDSTIIAQAPKLASYIPQMRATIANDLHVDINVINVKAKTNEKLDALGRSEGIAAQVVVLLTQNGQTK